MDDDRLRKLGIAGGAVALFVGFIFLTRWTGDDPDSVASLGDQEQADLEQFCWVFASDYIPYEVVLRMAAGEDVPDGEAGGLVGADSFAAQEIAQSVLTRLADRVPEEYGADARKAAEGLERAVDGNLDPEDVDSYVTGFDELQAKAADDCEAVAQLEDETDGSDIFGEPGDGGFGGDSGGFGEPPAGPGGPDGSGGFGGEVTVPVPI